MEGYNYLLSLCVILMSTKIFSIISRRAQLPQVVGALMAGLFFGPAVLGALTSKIFGFPFCLMPTPLLSRLAELGVIVIMFTAGMETNIDELKASGKVGFAVALSGVIVPLGMGAGLMYIFDKNVTFASAIFVGAVLTATSVSITVETLKELGKMSTKVGNTILAAALIDDILGLICLTLITGMAGEEVNLMLVLIKIVGFFLFVGIAGFSYYYYMVWSDRIQAARNLRRYPVMGFAFCLFMAWAAEVVFGVADIIGAFAAGMIIAMAPKGQYIASKFDTIAYLLLTPIFFANIGLEVTLPTMSYELVIFTIALVIVSVISKLGGCGLGAKLCGFDGRQSYQIGLGMVCRGEVALIVAGKGMAMNLISEDFLGPIIIMIIVCTIITPIVLKSAFKGQTDVAGDSVFEDKFMVGEQADEIEDDLFNRRLRLTQRSHEL
ncbi:MAG: cation:proton antiporter [Synergistales bacterium]|nr:cation:proton antiporter [Synergistales bacterium]MDY6401105.1 cation:proton antiporter [Synergistales bacterium]MDY6404698.1 cation:proton antiporter [Synergistales bacterium]MDY6410886.1 cation:proton antiporter [Synergistales bacterium]MDY6415143.1 cation:proton antiporter [Synergistales bacterium]